MSDEQTYTGNEYYKPSPKDKFVDEFGEEIYIHRPSEGEIESYPL